MSFLRPDLRCLDGIEDSERHRKHYVVDRFLEPVHLVGLASAVQSDKSAARTSTLEVHGDPARYAARMRLDVALDLGGCGHALPVVRERRQGDRLLEVVGLEDAASTRKLAALVHRRVRQRSAAVAGALFESICEMGINVHEHAHPDGLASSLKGFAAAQTMDKTSEVVFAVSDFGVGLRTTLEGRGAQDDRHALELALRGTSRFADQVTRGLGVPDTVALVTHLGGSFFLATGTATASTDRSRRVSFGSAPRYAGTLLQARIPL